MKLETLSYSKDSGWSADFPKLDSSQTLVIVFGAAAYIDDPAPIETLSAAYPASTVIGCSTSGEIFATEVFDDTLSVAIVRFDNTPIQSAFVPIKAPAESRAVGELVARQLLRDDLRGVIVLSEGINVNGDELVAGMNSVLSDTVVVTGGLAGDGARFQRTWIIHEGRPHPSGVTAVAFYGSAIRIGHGSKGGWDMFGPERIVTKATGNVLYELDGEPALALYKRYLGERASGLPATGLLFPLALRDVDGKELVRTILSIDEASQSMIFAGNIAEGARAQFMKANFDRLVEGASEAAAITALSAPAEGPALALAISCVGRRLVLGERSEEETEATLASLPPGTAQIGFYSYGEISPFATGHCDLHNQTMTLTLLSEA